MDDDWNCVEICEGCGVVTVYCQCDSREDDDDKIYPWEYDSF